MKPTRTVLRCVILMLLVSLGISVASAAGYNQSLKDGFQPNGTTSILYARGGDIENLAKAQYQQLYFGGDDLTLTYYLFEINYCVRFYSTPDTGNECAVEFLPGKYRMQRPNLYIPQGFQGYPASQQGWRYVRMPKIEFDSKKEVWNISDPDECSQRWYYVKTEDLKRLRKSILAQNEGLYCWRPTSNAGYTKRECDRALIRSTDLFSADRLLYENGDYLSPDLFRPLWDWKCTALSIGIVLLLIPERLLARREKTVRIGKSNQKAL